MEANGNGHKMSLPAIVTAGLTAIVGLYVWQSPSGRAFTARKYAVSVCRLCSTGECADNAKHAGNDFARRDSYVQSQRQAGAGAGRCARLAREAIGTLHKEELSAL